MNHWLPASSISSSAPVPGELAARASRAARSHVSVQATRWAPFSSPVSSCSSRSSATVRAGSSGIGGDPTTALRRERGKNRRVASRGLARPAIAPRHARAALRSGSARRRSRSPSLWGLWELYRWIWATTGWTWPFPVDDVDDAARLHDRAGALRAVARNGPLLIDVLWHSALFTAKEAVAGFALGAIVGFAIGVCSSTRACCSAGFLPYIVASQTVPILAIAPMVVIWVNPKLPGRSQGWGRSR